MTTTNEDEVRFYFSFRSPYSWLAFVRIEQALSPLPVTLSYLPVFPPKDFPNDPSAVPNKFKYIRADARRVARAYGFRSAEVVPLDAADWMRPHAAYMYAVDQGKGREFALALYSARFEDGRDIGDDGVMSQVARALSLDADALLVAAGDEAFQTRVFAGMMQGVSEDSLFGVPYFVYRGETFWGNDRVHWLVRAVRQAHGQAVVDLAQDPLQLLDRAQ